MLVSPSLLSANFLNLVPDIEMLNKYADFVHLDVMDGSLVKNISFGFSVLDQLPRITTVPMDTHLMVVHPERWFEKCAKDNVQMLSFHYEASGRNTSDCIDQIHALGMKAGVAIDPDVPVKKLFQFIGKADFFLIMSVFAGFGGQKFIYESLDRVAELRKQILSQGASALIEVDGGVNLDNVGPLAEAGADIVVAGSTVFKSADPAATIAALQKA